MAERPVADRPVADRQTQASQPQTGSESKQQMSRGSQPGGLSRRPLLGMDPFFMLSPRDFFMGNPFSLMRRMTEQMDHMLSEFIPSRDQGDSSMWSPAVEVAERDGNYIISAELPGLKPDEVKVEVTDNALTIQGERKYKHEEERGGVRTSERRYGQFFRSLPLPEGVNADQIRANFENGVLEVTVPAPQQQSNKRQIPIQGTSSGTQSSGTQSQPSASGTQQGGRIQG